MRTRLGFDIGGTSVHGIAVDADDADRVLAESVVPTRPGADGVLASVTEVHAALVADGHEVVSAGVGIPGIVEHGHVSHAVNLGLGDVPFDVASAVSRLTGVKAVVDNDVKAAALGASQWLRSTGRTGDDLALLNVGTGLAAALVLDGRLRYGHRGLAGEIGHLVVDPDGPPCSCGKHGCLELYASGSGMARRWPGSAAALFAAASEGVPLAVEVRDDLVAGVAHAVRTLVHLVDVEHVVLTGGVAGTPALQLHLLDHLSRDEADSAFERTVGTAGRLRVLPADWPAGSRGAALLGSL